MANSEHLAKIKEGVGAWNDWRRANVEIVPDLREADLCKVDLSRAHFNGAQFAKAYLRGADLRWASLYEANLNRADLGGTNLSGAYLHRAHLIRANLRETDLTWARLITADLSEADLGGADLRGADLLGTDLGGADLTWASIGYTTFGDNDLSDVKGLESVRHDAPSTIGIDTIYRSHGSIPLAFLRGAGVPDNFIEYMESLTGKALEFYSCFISYSTKDQEFADRLHADLQNKGVRCWFAPHDIQAGKKIHEQIDEAIRRYERLLLILSTNSMKSAWVKTEIRKARKREIEEKRRVLFPVSIVAFTDVRMWESFYADEGIDLAEEIREYYIPDFSDWKNHDSYAKGLKKLLGGLKAENPRPSGA